MADYLNSAGFDFRRFTAVPVPLSRTRERTRGFNQSELLAEATAELLRIRKESGNLVRSKHTKPQTGLESRNDRERNVKECFTLRDPERMKGANVLLVDDVTTSGATLREAARTLRSAGVKHVVAIVLAKAD